MKKIGIDARLYFQTGIGVYLRNLLSNLQKISPDNLIFYIYILKNESKKIFFSSKNFIKREVSATWHSFSEQLNFLKVLLDDNLDLMHFTYFGYPILYKRKFLATIHDLTPLLFKTGKASTQNRLFYEVKYLFFKLILKNQIINATKIITPTKFVRKQIINIYGQELNNKIIPIYEGVDETLFGVKENRSLNERFKNNFFLYVGNFYPHKNVERLIKVFSRIKNDCQLILVGPDDFFAQRISHIIKMMNLSKKVIIYHNPSPQDLVFFYKNALALIHPSLSEGFGLPLIEAAYFNCPIIASDILPFKELLNGNYLSFSPQDESDIFEKISFFLTKKIRFNYHSLFKRYSFKNMTKKTLNIYQELLKS